MVDFGTSVGSGLADQVIQLKELDNSDRTEVAGAVKRMAKFGSQWDGLKARGRTLDRGPTEI